MTSTIPVFTKYGHPYLIGRFNMRSSNNLIIIHITMYNRDF